MLLLWNWRCYRNEAQLVCGKTIMVTTDTHLIYPYVAVPDGNWIAFCCVILSASCVTFINEFLPRVGLVCFIDTSDMYVSSESVVHISNTVMHSKYVMEYYSMLSGTDACYYQRVGRVCRDSANAQYMQYLSKNHITSQIHWTLFKCLAFIFECLYDQQDSYHCPKASQKTAKYAVVKVPFSYSLFRLLWNTDNLKTCAYLEFSTKLMLITACSFTTTHRLPSFKVTLVDKAVHSTVQLLYVPYIGCHFCTYIVLFPGRRPQSLVWEQHQWNCACWAVSPVSWRLLPCYWERLMDTIAM